MSISVACYLDDVLLEDEPIGLSDIQLSLIRDKDAHGIGFQASTSPLQFITNGFEYLNYIKCTRFMNAHVTFKAFMQCAPGQDPITVVEGKVNFSSWKKACGDGCSVSLGIESVNCEVLLNNRFSQAVNLDNTLAYDGVTGLVNYDDLAVMLPLPPKVLDYESSGVVDPAGNVEDFDFPSPGGGSEGYVLARPDYKDINTNIADTHLANASTIGYSGPNGINIPVSNQVLFNEANAGCFQGPIAIKGRLKGRILIPGVTNLDVYAVFLNGELNADWPINDPTTQLVEQFTLGTNIDVSTTPFEFDVVFTDYNWLPVNNGSDGIYQYIAMHQHPGADFVGTITFDPESFFSAITVKECPATNAALYTVHETLSRVVESVTNNCCRVKSEYYGRTDSQPFSFPQDGCGGLRAFTSGLKIRNAKNATLFASPEDLLKGLKAIDNIGWGIEPDVTAAGNFVLRVEDLDYFYQDVEMFRALQISKTSETIDITKIYATINIGYLKWETQANFGLDEYNSDREYHTSITEVTTKLDQRSALVAGEYAIELTREQQFAETDAADTTYDNEIFIICLERLADLGYPYGGLIVEQGGVATATNIFNPDSTYNYRISPVRNLMRWFRSIVNSYANIFDSDNRVFFSKGTGNLLAQGRLADADINPCSLEKVPIKESQDILQTLFKDVKDATPLWRNETVIFDFPMQISEYANIKANPYGYISFQCDNGDIEQGWISQLKFKPFTAEANFTLIKRWVDVNCGNPPN